MNATIDAARVNPSVLVVEDEPHIRELVALHLRLEGWTPELVDNGVTALDHLRAHPYDLVILDTVSYTHLTAADEL